MNFFKLYIGDYQRDTAHLSVTEHGAYLLMLQHFYATEKPLPTAKALHRMLRAETKAERDAIDVVAGRFWIPIEGGVINERAAEEMVKAEHQRTVNREIGKRGGRPKKTELETESVIDYETLSVSEREPINNPNQTPDTRHQTKAGKEKPSAFALPAWIPAEVWSEWMPIRKAKKANNSPYALALLVAKLERWKDAGHDVAAILNASIIGGWSDVYEPKVFAGKRVEAEARRRAAVEEFIRKGNTLEVH